MKRVNVPKTLFEFLKLHFGIDNTCFNPESTNPLIKTEDFDVLFKCPVSTEDLIEAIKFFGTSRSYEVVTNNFGVILKQNNLPIEVICVTPNQDGYKVTKSIPLHSAD